jgi:cell volume regulation protein A
MTFTQLLIVIPALLLASLALGKLASRVGVPILLLFLGLGMLAGSDGVGDVWFDYPEVAQSIGVVALALILFSGGLATPWDDVRPVWKSGLSLSTLGVTVSTLLVAVFAHLALGFSSIEGVLLGAIIGATDAAAVFPALRGAGGQLKGRLRPLLELEAASNDPMAVFLALGALGLAVDPLLPPTQLILLFVAQMGLGAAFGVVGGLAMIEIVNRIQLEYDGLYPVVTLALALLLYGVTALLGGSGFLAVYLAGLMMARAQFLHKRSLTQFHDGIAWLMQIAMFITLGLQVFPSRLPAVAGEGLLVVAFIVLVARPASVFVALARSSFSIREKLFASWVGLRGASPIVLATFPLLTGIALADTIFHMVFFIVASSVLLQAVLVLPFARLLGVLSNDVPTISPLAYVMNDENISNDLLELIVPPDAWIVERRVIDMALPKDTLLVLVGRAGEMIVPRGDTVIHSDDHLLFLVMRGEREALRSYLQCVTRPTPPELAAALGALAGPS